MSKLNVNTPASESKESSSLTAKPSEEISYEAIRRALRRSLFFKDHPQFNVNTAALRSDFAMNLEYLTAAPAINMQLLPASTVGVTCKIFLTYVSKRYS
ncbi:hypothetical protein [Pantoea agglomerans]|uniref:hypothetical protein n=1 Tax=Enterobacter agglomerans TaxID=549 RepID=UPI003209726E